MTNASNVVARVLAQCEQGQFWGTVTIRFKEGAPVMVTRTEEFKVSEGLPVKFQVAKPAANSGR